MVDRVYIVVLNWNGTEDTIDCLKSIKNNNYDNYTVILVDNGSEKEEYLGLMNWCYDSFTDIQLYSKAQVDNDEFHVSEGKSGKAESNERLVLIENDENLGFAAGNNVALRYILKIKATYAMLLNNDTVIEKDSITVLMNFLGAHKEYVAATPQIRYFDPKEIIWNCGGKITWFGNRKYFYAKENIANVPQTGFKQVTFITGCALLFKPEKTGVLTERYFFGEEDLDFSFRQKKEKNKMACCFSSIIYHKVNASVNKLDGNILGSVYLQYISRLINNRQHSSHFMLIVKTIVILGYAIPMIKIRYKISFNRIFLMLKTLLKELNRIDKIDKDYCFKYLKEDFT